MSAIFPPTPAPSTDINGKPSTTSTIESIALPPAAIASARSSVSSNNSSDSSYRPTRKRSSAAAELETITSDGYELPPPPTRSRKIIQMKPPATKTKQQHRQSHTEQDDTFVPAGKASSSQGSDGVATATTASGGKRRQANASTAAGRKIARKTAHSLIERRRRSKMNEEFGVLKDMIPACAGQEMHKLAILQASIDYMRYLEGCVTELKSSKRDHKHSEGPSDVFLPEETMSRSTPAESYEDDEDESEDNEAGSATATSAQHYGNVSQGFTCHADVSRNQRPSESPAILASATTSPLFSRPATGNFDPPSALPSPAFAAQGQQNLPRLPSLSLTSPNMPARRDEFTFSLPALGGTAGASGNSKDIDDHKATASALLMLNTDRRSWTGRGLSVKDLLSSQ